MGWEWDPWGLPGCLAALVEAALAFVIYHIRPDRLQNRALAAFLFIGAASDFLRLGLRFFATDEATAYALYVVSVSVIGFGQAAFLVFLGTLPGRASAWLRLRWTRALLAAAGLAWFALLVLRPQWYAVDVVATKFFDSWIIGVPGPFYRPFLFWAVGINLYGAVVALLAIRETTTRLERRKAQAFAAALVVFNILNIAYLGYFIIGAVVGPWAHEYLTFFGPGLAALVFTAMLAYGIVHAQVFDLDIKLKWTVKRGTLAGIFIATFFVVSQLIQNVTSDTFGVVVGAVAAGLLLFAINPLQRLAERLSAAAVPNADGDSIQVRKSEVYKAALEGALQDGKLTTKERSVLTRLQLELGIANAEAKALEIQVRKAMGVE